MELEIWNLMNDVVQSAYEIWKARKVVKSRDIAFAFTNVMANDYYSLSQSSGPFTQIRNELIP